MSSFNTVSLAFLVSANLVFTSALAADNPDMVFRYKSDSVGEINAVPEGEVSPECYDPSKAGTIGDAPGCDGMLIVDTSTLRSIAYTSDDWSAMGPDSQSYTFPDSQRNIFTGQVTDMSGLFYKKNFDGDIGYWDTSKVTDMGRMFYENSQFNSDIGEWDTSKVTDMQRMFYKSYRFNQNINNWDVSNVENMRLMFFDADGFDKDISSWDVSSVKDMTAMFKYCGFGHDLSNWDVSSVTSYSQFNAWSGIRDSEMPDF